MVRLELLQQVFFDVDGSTGCERLGLLVSVVVRFARIRRDSSVKLETPVVPL